ncbi:hypothetical protein [Bacillus sp. B15-48]|uniref:hypothetical protein n=1 Tax=Bacillus sp. B15-48 TaxID=1548601 RepID=UPI00193F0784|nr:hypothetical protein [Bacillus sp. B15-48]MBM4765261.1 hypothetical protein [Bacillus sp. B15-48]
MNKKIVVFLLLFVFISSTTVYAHKMLIAPIEEGVIQVVYEDGSFSTRTVVYVYDQEGNEVDQARLDSDGYFYYEEIGHTFVADDGMGHRTEWTVGEEIVIKSDPHRWIIIGIVVTVFVSIAIVSSYLAKRKH